MSPYSALLSFVFPLISFNVLVLTTSIIGSPSSVTTSTLLVSGSTGSPPVVLAFTVATFPISLEFSEISASITVYSAVITFVALAGNSPIVNTYPLVLSPLIVTPSVGLIFNSPAIPEIVSFTTTSFNVVLPSLVTVIVYVIFCPNFTFAPLGITFPFTFCSFTTEISFISFTVTVASSSSVIVSLPSLYFPVTVTVFVIFVPAVNTSVAVTL